VRERLLNHDRTRRKASEDQDRSGSIGAMQNRTVGPVRGMAPRLVLAQRLERQLDRAEQVKRGMRPAAIDRHASSR
jgi:hypothetical protein